jgi:membrane dipeptidase
MTRVLTGLLLLVVLAVVGFFTVGTRMADGQMNTVVSTTLPPVSPVASALHRRLFVADLHADQLLWGRDPLARVARGHVDVPRLQEGHVALQVFSVVTKTPRGMNYDQNTGETDNVLLLALAQRWPRATWTSLRARAVYQADQLRDAALRSANTLTLITTREEMAAFVERRAGDPAQLSALLAIEGLHALDGTLESVDTLYAAGFRMMGLAHFFDNEVAASAHGAHAARSSGGRAHGSAGHHRRSRACVVTDGAGGARHGDPSGGGVAHRRSRDVPGTAQSHG